MNFLEFATILKKENIRPAKGLQVLDQINDGKIIEVSKIPESQYRPLYCWFNCLSHSKKYGGKVVFGWSLYFKNELYQAQHHAVWLSPADEYFDLTPDNRNSITHFLVDNRAPFCFETFRRPMNFYYSSNKGIKGWGDIKSELIYPEFWIGCPADLNDLHIHELLRGDA